MKNTNRRKSIESFLRGKRMALVGASRNPNDFRRVVLRELIVHGYDMVPVNASGVPRVWLHQGVGPGAGDAKAVELLRGRGVDVVAGKCPMMLLGDGKGVHRLHGWIRRILGTYPSAA